MGTLHTQQEAVNIVNNANGKLAVSFLVCGIPGISDYTRVEEAYSYGSNVLTSEVEDDQWNRLGSW